MKKVKFYCLILLISVMTMFASAQSTAFKPSYQFLHSNSIIQDKIFYFLTLIKQLPDLHNLLSIDKVFQQHLTTMKSILQRTKNNPPDNNISNEVASFLWTDEENDAIKNELNELFKKHNQSLQILCRNMRSSGYFIKYDSLNDISLVKKAWEDAAKGMNYIINAYTTNKGMYYPSIDSTTFAVNSEIYKYLIKETSLILDHKKDSMDLFFEPALQLSLSLLFINYRDEATRYQPLDSTNAKAYRRIPHVDWEKYPYSLILIPGKGPEDNKSISILSKYRCMLGAENYRKGLAPFIVVSGGFVHPFQTPYCEAFEMKKYLIEELGIPDSVVIMEPHARHTTTNIRNTNRIVYRQLIPADKHILCTSTTNQIDYIYGEEFKAICIRAMNYLPWRDMKRINMFNLAFYPVEESLQMDATDPLDP